MKELALIELVVQNGKSEVDDDGFVALVDSAYEGYVGEDWSLREVLERFASERRAEHAVIAYPGPALANSPLELSAAPVDSVVRSFQATLTVTDGRVWLCDYAQLTMAAEDPEVSAVETYTPWIAVPSGRYLVTMEQARTSSPGTLCVHVNLEPLEPLDSDSGPVDTAHTLVPWFEDPAGLD